MLLKENSFKAPLCCCSCADADVLLQDDNGFIYHTDNTGTVYARDPNTPNLNILVATASGTGGTSLANNAEALAFKRLHGVRILYGCSQNNAGISKLQINYSGGKPASFSTVAPISILAFGGCRGVVVEDDGTLFYTGVAVVSGSVASHFVAKVRARLLKMMLC